jgi:uracil phosphoribosyltransferase
MKEVSQSLSRIEYELDILRDITPNTKELKELVNDIQKLLVQCQLPTSKECGLER